MAVKNDTLFWRARLAERALGGSGLRVTRVPVRALSTLSFSPLTGSYEQSANRRCFATKTTTDIDEFWNKGCCRCQGAG